MQYKFNCKDINNLTSFHYQIKNTFKFPDYYGSNLDALLDCLSQLSANLGGNQLTQVHFKNFAHLVKVFEPDYIVSIISVFDYWKAGDPDIEISVIFEL